MNEVNSPQSHRGHRDDTEKTMYMHSSVRLGEFLHVVAERDRRRVSGLDVSFDERRRECLAGVAHMSSWRA